ncbi:MAG: hypothetical protein ACK4N5_16650, partial [Myxococcales bacterium]
TEESEARTVSVVRFAAPAPIHPVADVVLRPGVPVPFVWTSVGADAYELEVTRNEGGNTHARLESALPHVQLGTQLEEGTWCYRVRARLAGATTDWSTRTCFQISPAALPAPRLLEPRWEAADRDRHGALDLLWTLVGGVAFAEPAASLVLRWQPIAGAARYVVEISEDPVFERPVLTREVPHARYRWVADPQRTYWWRVRAVARDGHEGPWSEASRLMAESAGAGPEAPALVSPAAGAQIVADREPIAVELEWTHDAGAPTATVEVARDEAFRDTVASATVDGTRWSFRVPSAGTWHWRVQVQTAGGAARLVSATSSFEVVPAPPTLRADRRTVDVGEDGTSAVSLAWSGVLIAAYEFELASDAAFHSVVLRRERVDEPQLRAVLHGPASYHWRVRGMAPHTAWSATGRVVVRPSPPAPRVADDGDVRWTAVPGAAGYVVEVRSGDRVLSTTQVSQTRAQRPPAGSGRAQLVVRAVHASGVSSRWSAPLTLEAPREASSTEAPQADVARAPDEAAARSAVQERETAAAVQVGLGVGVWRGAAAQQAFRAVGELDWWP